MSAGRGAIYLAIGVRFLDEARVSAASVRRHMPDLHITVFTDQQVSCGGEFDAVVAIAQSGPKAHRDKIRACLLSPYQETLFLDTDTFVAADLTSVWDVLDSHDLAASDDRGYQDRFPAGSGVPDCFTELNLGVVFFRRSAVTTDLFHSALRRYDELSEAGRWLDQPAFRLELFRSPVRVARLPKEYNCRFPHYGELNGTVKVLHGRHPNAAHDAANLGRVVDRLNESTRPRVFVAGRCYELVLSDRRPDRRHARRVRGYLDVDRGLRVRELWETIKRRVLHE